MTPPFLTFLTALRMHVPVMQMRLLNISPCMVRQLHN